MPWYISLLINSAALLVADYFLNSIEISGVVAAAVAAIVLGFVNTFIRPLLLLLTLPLTVVTLGLFILFVNALTFSFVSWLVPGFHVYSFGGAFAGAIITSITSWVLNSLFASR